MYAGEFIRNRYVTNESCIRYAKRELNYLEKRCILASDRR